jgi:spore germination cell wall hydrolase CwlJ-like protein
MNSLYQLLGGILVSIIGGIYLHYNVITHSRIQESLPIPYTASITHHSLLDHEQLDCMARNIFFEARGESAQGKAMVGLVVLERVRSPHFPHTICGVVTQANRDINGHIIKNECSFSWICDGQEHDINLSNPAVQEEWKQSYLVAEMVMLHQIKEKIDMDGVTHYHNQTVSPDWAHNKNYKLVAIIGHHLFYRWKNALLPGIENPKNQYAMR